MVHSGWEAADGEQRAHRCGGVAPPSEVAHRQLHFAHVAPRRLRFTGTICAFIASRPWLQSPIRNGQRCRSGCARLRLRSTRAAAPRSRSVGRLDRQRVGNEAPRPGGWRGAARERCLATLARIARQGRDKRARAAIIAPRQGDAKHHKWGGGSSGLSRSGSLEHWGIPSLRRATMRARSKVAGRPL
jgi:hypothetical protein